MLTRKRWTPPMIPQNVPPEVQAYLREQNKSISDYLLSLEAKGSLTINEAEITASQGIKFPATQVASSDVNVLDDYEEGTWTPSLGGNTTYTTQVGTYVKIGKWVIVQGQIVVNAIGTGSTGTITGLPFTPAATLVGWVGYFANSVTNYSFMGCFVTAAPALVLNAIGAAGASMTTPAVVFQNGTNVEFAAAYYI